MEISRIYRDHPIEIEWSGTIHKNLIEIRPFFKTGLFLDKAWGHSLYFGHPTDFLRVR
jgi:hypothetical protein